MSDVERELLDATSLSIPAKFSGAEDKQEFLKILVAQIDKLPDETWKGLSDKAQAWANAAMEAMQKGSAIPEINSKTKANGKDHAPSCVRLPQDAGQGLWGH